MAILTITLDHTDLRTLTKVTQSIVAGLRTFGEIPTIRVETPVARYVFTAKDDSAIEWSISRIVGDRMLTYYGRQIDMLVRGFPNDRIVAKVLAHF